MSDQLTIKDLDAIAQSAGATPFETAPLPPRRPWTPFDIVLACIFLIPCVNFVFLVGTSTLEEFSKPSPTEWAAHMAQVEQNTEDASRSDLGQFATNTPAPKADVTSPPTLQSTDESMGSPKALNPGAAAIDASAIADDCVAKRAPFVCINDRFLHQPDKMRIEGYVALANAFRAAGNEASAVEAWSFLIGVRPSEAKFYNARCWQRFVWNRDLNEALADCTKALELRPGDANTLDSRGSVLLRLGRFDEAIADFNNSLAHENFNVHAIYGRGLARVRSGRVEAGKADIKQAKAAASAIDIGFYSDDSFDGA